MLALAQCCMEVLPLLVQYQPAVRDLGAGEGEEWSEWGGGRAGLGEKGVDMVLASITKS